MKCLLMQLCHFWQTIHNGLDNDTRQFVLVYYMIHSDSLIIQDKHCVSLVLALLNWRSNSGNSGEHDVVLRSGENKLARHSDKNIFSWEMLV